MVHIFSLHQSQRNNNTNGCSRLNGSGHNHGCCDCIWGRDWGERFRYHQQGAWHQSQTLEQHLTYPPWTSQWQLWATPPYAHILWLEIGKIQSLLIVTMTFLDQNHIKWTSMQHNCPMHQRIFKHIRTLSIAPPNEHSYIDVVATSHTNKKILHLFQYKQ